MITIEFFKLDEVDERKNLLSERARVITGLWHLLDKTDSTSVDLVEAAQSPTEPHSSCAKCFVALYRSGAAGREKAKELYKDAARLVIGKS
ncbi:MAG: hypothetical protein M9894_00300 [Planctomycetes bacterium]|nr:hypothetical protein [Planctomycetota bacterium]MCW8138988.1 hypothetical protein [Planctomycetota bacterium]